MARVTLIYNGVLIHTLDDIRDNFNFMELKDDLQNGKLFQWLEMHKHQDIAARIQELDLEAGDLDVCMMDLLEMTAEQKKVYLDVKAAEKTKADIYDKALILTVKLKIISDKCEEFAKDSQYAESQVASLKKQLINDEKEMSALQLDLLDEKIQHNIKGLLGKCKEQLDNLEIDESNPNYEHYILELGFGGIPGSNAEKDRFVFRNTKIEFVDVRISESAILDIGPECEVKTPSIPDSGMIILRDRPTHWRFLSMCQRMKEMLKLSQKIMKTRSPDDTFVLWWDYSNDIFLHAFENRRRRTMDIFRGKQIDKIVITEHQTDIFIKKEFY